MSNILIAQIGRGNYLTTRYLNGEQIKKSADFTYDASVFTTGYTFEATMHEICCSSGDKMDHVILIGTDTSYFGSLLHYYYKKSIDNEVEITQESYDRFVTLPELKALSSDMRLESSVSNGKTIFNIEIKNVSIHLEQIEALLTGYIRRVTGNEGLRIKLVIIRYGITSQELEYNFDTLRKSVEEILDNEDIYTGKRLYNIFFDISNGFRSLPMYIYTFVNYLLRIRDEQFNLHMFYGMAEAKRDMNGIAPIVNLENINGMMEWINAANEFHNYGSVRQLGGLLHDNPALHTLFQQFDYASNANNLGVLKATTEEIIKLKDMEQFENLPYYAKALLCKIGEEFNQEFKQDKRNPGLNMGSYSYAYLTIHLAHWYMEQGRTGNAAIALQEGITTFMMERWPDETDGLISISQNQSHGRYFEQNSTRWLFDFKNRSVISELFKEKTPDFTAKVESETELTLTEKMCVIREYIRNPEAHILINQISDSLIEKSQKILGEMIEWMLKLVSDHVDKTDEKPLFQRIPTRHPLKESVKLYFKEITNLSNPVHTVVIHDPKVLEAVQTVERELKFLKECQIVSSASENAMVSKFQKNISSKKYLGKLLEKWLMYDPDDHQKNPAYSEEACKKLLRRNIKNRTTEQRVIGWMGTHDKDIFDIIIAEE